MGAEISGSAAGVSGNGGSGMRLCSMDGCGKNHKAYGFCNTHYKQMKYIPSAVGVAKRCDVAGCASAHYGGGFCRKHYDAKRRAENPEFDKLHRESYRANPENKAKEK